MSNLNALAAANAGRWTAVSLTRDFTPAAVRLISREAKNRYLAVSSRTAVPWAFIAVAHERESSQNWAASLAQGDPWDKVSVHVLKGRGPFASWEDAAVDALVNCPPFAARNRDWSIGGTLTMLEQYNGLGYYNRGMPSPYLWSGTDQYKAGKFVRDGVYDPNAVDRQLGCAGLLREMMALDPSIEFAGATSISIRPKPIASTKAAPSDPTPKPSIGHPAKGSVGAFVAAFLSAIFRRK